MFQHSRTNVGAADRSPLNIGFPRHCGAAVGPSDLTAPLVFAVVDPGVGLLHWRIFRPAREMGVVPGPYGEDPADGYSHVPIYETGVET